MEAIKHETNNGYFSVLIQDKNISVWVDVSIDEKYKDVYADFNQYIFDMNNSKDIEIKKYQDDNENFMRATSKAIQYLEDKELIYQDDNANWFLNN